MKRTLLTIGIAIISMCGCFGQKMPKLHNEVIEASKEYQNGNAFQKDLLMMAIPQSDIGIHLKSYSPSV